MQIGETAPDFELSDLQGTLHRLADYRGRIVVINFWSCECPQSERTDGPLTALLAPRQGEVALWFIASNRNEPVHTLAQVAHQRHLPLVLLDARQAVADLYEAQTTPHVFVVDRAGILRYRGAVDNVTFRQRQPTSFFLQEAVAALLEGRQPGPEETPAYGCTIVREL